MLNKTNTGLIIVDVQGKLAEIMHESDALLQQLSVLIRGVKSMGLPVIWMEQIPEKLGPTKAQIAELLDGEPLSKNTFSGWQTEAIAAAIRTAGCENWLVAGIETHVCVYQTVADMLAEGFKLHLVTDAVSSRVLANKQLAIDKMAAMGASLTSVEMALFELQKIAEGDEFRALIKIVK